MNDIDYIRPKTLLKYLRAPPTEPISESIARYIFYKPDKPAKLFTKLITLTDNDIRYLPKTREMHNKISLPQPLELELSKHLLRNWSDKYSHYNIYKEFIVMASPERDQYMADYMKEFAEKNNLRILHAIVGLAHEARIEYFLKNPNYPGY